MRRVDIALFLLSRRNVLLVLLLVTVHLFGQENASVESGLAMDWALAPTEDHTHNAVDHPGMANWSSQRAGIKVHLPPYYLKTGTGIVLSSPPVLKTSADSSVLLATPAEHGTHASLAIKERQDLIAWLNEIGLTVFEIQRAVGDRVAEERSTYPAHEELLNGLRWAQQKADSLELDSEQIGLLGFFDSGIDAVELARDIQRTNRPAFVGIIGALSPVEGNWPTQTGELPGLFIALSAQSAPAALEDATRYQQFYLRSGGAAELHLYQTDALGFRDTPFPLPAHPWRDQFHAWLNASGLLQKLYPNKYEKLYGQESFARGKEARIERMQNDFAQLGHYQEENEKLEIPGADERRVVMLGNSITAAWSLVDSAFFREHRLINRGISAQTSTQLLLRFRQDVIELRPRAVVMLIGTNDVAENTGPYRPEQTLNNVKSMVDLARFHDIAIVLCAVLPATKFEWNRKLGDRSREIIALNAALEAYARAEDIPFVDYHAAMTNEAGGMDPDLAADGVHPTLAGYRVMEARLLPILNRLNQE